MARFSKTLRPAAVALFGAMAFSAPAMAAMDIGHGDGVTPRPELDKEIQATIKQCAEVAPSCADEMQSAAGALVFPDVVTVDLIVGGAGGNGALVQDGKITGYYDIGEASAGAQIGIKSASQVYVARDESTLEDLMQNGQWELSAATDLTVIAANATASTQTGDPLVYVFDSNGLNASVNVSVLNIWEDTGSD